MAVDPKRLLITFQSLQGSLYSYLLFHGSCPGLQPIICMASLLEARELIREATVWKIMKKSTTIFDFFKRKVSNDLEANTSGVTLLTTNVEENPDVPIEENLDIPIEENLDELVKENLDVPIEQNSQTKFQKSQHIDRVVSNFTSKQIANNQVRLKASIDVVRHLALQAIAFRGRDESSTSTNRGNFLTTLDLMVSYNNNIVEIMAKAPKNATYTSPHIQKEILHVISTKVKKAIREEIGDAKFCILVDEARDESIKEQMVVVLRYVDTNGFVRERFYRIIHVVDIAVVTLKKEIYDLFSNCCLDIQNIWGQRYDGASNMRGKWNGLQALILNDCSYAYYIHCFAHRLQLALVGASKAVVPLNRFFTKLILVSNNIRASCKCIEQLKIARASDIAYLIDIEELETRKGLDQMVTLQRPRDTRWGSHYKSVSNLIMLFSPTCEGLLKIMDEGNSSQKVEAESAYEVLISFEFVFILHFVNETLGIADKLCQTLQNQSQDILNAMHLVLSTKKLIQQFRDEKWDDLLATVISFCKERGLDVPDMNSRYVARFG
nr:zinc finger MYM-type protein 1-like [Quercus suber]